MQRWSRQVSCSMLSQSYSANMVVGDDGISTSWRAFDENPIFCVFSPPPWPVFEVPLQVVLKVVAACVPGGTARRGYSRMDRNCHRPFPGFPFLDCSQGRHAGTKSLSALSPVGHICRDDRSCLMNG